MTNEILLASYWEHYKCAKDLAMYLPTDNPKRIKIEEELNILIKKLNIKNNE